MTKLRAALESDDDIPKHQYQIDDGTGRKVKLRTLSLLYLRIIFGRM